MAMKKNNDALGQQLWHAFKGKEAYEIVERDDGFVGPSGGAQNYFAEFRQWPKRQKQAIRLAKARVLDIGSGAGRVGLYLQDKGVDVVSIDNSPLAIKVCKQRGLKNASVLPIERISSFRTDSFNTVVMFGNNFGLFGSQSKARKLLEVLHRITSADGRIIAESLDPYQTDDPAHLSYHRRNKARGRMGGQVRIRIRFKNYIGAWFDYLLVSRAEMERIVRGTGWKVSASIDSGGPMYIAVFEKER